MPRHVAWALVEQLRCTRGRDLSVAAHRLQERDAQGVGSGNHETIIEHAVNGRWSITPTPDLSADQGDNGFAGISAAPGGGIWAVGIRTNGAGNPATLIEYHK